MEKTKEQLKAEIRYAIRLCQRTARLYRRVQTTGVFFSILGGSAVFATISGGVPSWVAVTGGILLSIAGAALIAIRPADKAALNEADIRRYQALMPRAEAMTPDQLDIALNEAHQGDAPEVEPLRDVAFNDVMMETNRMDCAIPLSASQRFLKSIA
jgi:hypothetical protein